MLESNLIKEAKEPLIMLSSHKSLDTQREHVHAHPEF